MDNLVLFLGIPYSSRDLKNLYQGALNLSSLLVVVDVTKSFLNTFNPTFKLWASSDTNVEHQLHYPVSNGLVVYTAFILFLDKNMDKIWEKNIFFHLCFVNPELIDYLLIRGRKKPGHMAKHHSNKVLNLSSWRNVEKPPKV